MATATTHAPYVPPISPDELKRKNAAAMRLLDQFEVGDEQDQKETMAILREALGSSRTISDRSAFR